MNICICIILVEIIIEDWIDHTKSLCWKHGNYYCGGSDYEDLVSEAYLTLVKACESYDDTRGSFAGYLSWKVHYAIIDYKRRQLRLRVKSNRGLQFTSLSSKIDIDDPTMASIACIAGAHELEEILDAIEVSMEDRHLLKMYYVDNLKLDDIGQVLGLTRSGVHRRIKRVLKGIKEKIK